MKAFEDFYEGPEGNDAKDLRILNMTASTFPKEYAKMFWKGALEWVKDMARDNKLHDANIKIWREIDEELEQ